MTTRFSVADDPKPQGSKRHIGNGIMAEDCKDLKDWREKLTLAAMTAHRGKPPIGGPVRVIITFFMPRPKNHYGTGRNAGKLRPSATDWCDKRPDLDKLVRAVFDATTDARVWKDDGQVSELLARKRYVYQGTVPGVTVFIQPLL